MPQYKQIPHSPKTYSEAEQLRRANNFYELLNERRSVRYFSNKKVSSKLIDTLIRTASTAPSGANKQPWTFCVVTKPSIKKQIRIAAEAEEYESYTNRMSDEWLQDLAPLATDWRKPFLEIAPALIIVFARSYEYNADGSKHQNYYVKESVGLACGMLLAAIQNVGLCSLTHTPSPMNFLSKILNRPENEKPFLLIPIGYAAQNCTVPKIKRKTLNKIKVKF